MTEGTPDEKQNMNIGARAEEESSSGDEDAQIIANNTNEDKKEKAIECIRQEFVEIQIEESEESKALKALHRRMELKMHLEAAVSVLITEVTFGFKDFTFPVRTLRVLGNRLHYIIYSRIVGMDMGDLLKLSVSVIVRNYRRRYNKEGDIYFMIEHYYKIKTKQEAEEADIANGNIAAGDAAAEVHVPPPVNNERQNEDAVNPPGPSAQ